MFTCEDNDSIYHVWVERDGVRLAAENPLGRHDKLGPCPKTVTGRKAEIMPLEPRADNLWRCRVRGAGYLLRRMDLG